MGSRSCEISMCDIHICGIYVCDIHTCALGLGGKLDSSNFMGVCTFGMRVCDIRMWVMSHDTCE